MLGDAQAAAVLSGLVSARMPERPNECSELLLALSENPSLCFPEVAEAAVAGLDFIGAHDKGTETFDWEPEERQRPLDPQFLENLLRALQRFKGGTLCGAAAEKIASRPEIFSPVTLVVPAIERICAGRGKRQRRLTAAFSICGRARRNSCSSAARFLRSRHRTGVWMSNSHVPVRIAGNYKPSLVIPPSVFTVFVSRKSAARHLHQ